MLTFEVTKADSSSGTTQAQSTTDELNFLRGVYQADSDGHLDMYTIVPGHYSGRSVHFHIKVLTEGSVASNGTFVAGRAVHTGE